MNWKVNWYYFKSLARERIVYPMEWAQNSEKDREDAIEDEEWSNISGSDRQERKKEKKERLEIVKENELKWV